MPAGSIDQGTLGQGVKPDAAFDIVGKGKCPGYQKTLSSSS
jgi:hypothetical protein